MLEAGCYTKITWLHQTLDIFKDIFNKEKQDEKLMNARVTEFIWDYIPIFDPETVWSPQLFFSYHNQLYHITSVSNRRSDTLCLHVCTERSLIHC